MCTLHDARGFQRDPKSHETAISEARSGEERENREDARKLCQSLDILFVAKENLWDQGTICDKDDKIADFFLASLLNLGRTANKTYSFCGEGISLLSTSFSFFSISLLPVPRSSCW